MKERNHMHIIVTARVHTQIHAHFVFHLSLHAYIHRYIQIHTFRSCTASTLFMWVSSGAGISFFVSPRSSPRESWDPASCSARDASTLDRRMRLTSPYVRMYVCVCVYVCRYAYTHVQTTCLCKHKKWKDIRISFAIARMLVSIHTHTRTYIHTCKKSLWAVSDSLSRCASMAASLANFSSSASRSASAHALFCSSSL
jgi:hypothetical protein